MLLSFVWLIESSCKQENLCLGVRGSAVFGVLKGLPYSERQQSLS